MPNKITITREDLIKAFQSYNKDTLKNEAEYGEINDSEQCAKSQADELLKHLAKVNKTK